MSETLPARDPMGHKGTFGTVGVVGGCVAGAARMLGAPALVARGAFRAGAGLVRVAGPDNAIADILTIEPSATGLAIDTTLEGHIEPTSAARALDELLETSGAIVIGPGLGAGDAVERLALRAAQSDRAPIILDADALNALALVPELAQAWRARAILTPHPGEWRRLADAVRASGDPIEPRGREEAAESLAQRLGCIVVLKGAGTVVSDGLRSWVCDAGGPALATAGTGDVLAGAVAAVVAAHSAPPEPAGLPDDLRAKLPRPPGRSLDLFDAARLGVLAHARAGEAWAHKHRAHGGALAREIADLLPAEVERLREPPATR